MTGSSTAQGSRDMMKTPLRFTVVARGVGLGSASWARRWLVTLALLIVIVAGVACDPQDARFAFANRTDAVLCQYGSPNDAALARCRSEVEPRAETVWLRDCDAKRGRPITMIITVEQGGDQIYSRTATCGEWLDSDRRVVIEQEGDDFVVTDSLQDSAPSP